MPQAPARHKRGTIGDRHKSSHRTQEARGNARERGYTSNWEKFRRAFLSRNPLCEFCLAKGLTVQATVCDHDLPHEHDPDLFWNNTFTALCKKDHDSTKQRMERKYKGDDLLRAIKREKRQIGRG